MATDGTSGPGWARPVPGLLHTDDTHTRRQRFSWQETPLEAQRPTFQQFSSPTNSIIDESPISPLDGHQGFQNQQQSHVVSRYVTEKPAIERIGSPYSLPPPTETHPAYFAPVVAEGPPRQPEPRQPMPTSGTDSKKTSQDIKQPALAPVPNAYAQLRKESAPIIKPDTDGSTLIHDHRPGQVAHPNAAVDPEWKHGLCEVDTLCCVGLCCPCILYGKTQYRISRKTQKEDPTNMLGYESCNGSCGLMGLACGFQCKSKRIPVVRIT